MFVGLISGSVGLTVGLFLRRIVARTPLQVPSYALFWMAVLLGGFGLLAGMAVEAVRQLQVTNPEADYHRGRHRRRGNRDA